MDLGRLARALGASTIAAAALVACDSGSDAGECSDDEGVVIVVEGEGLDRRLRSRSVLTRSRSSGSPTPVTTRSRRSRMRTGEAEARTRTDGYAEHFVAKPYFTDADANRVGRVHVG